MSESPISGPLARHTTSAAGQRAALRHFTLQDSLAENRYLSEDVWFALWPVKPKPSVKRATSLANRRLSPSQVSHVMRDGRVNVVKAMLVWNRPDDEALELALAAKNSQQLCETILEAEGSVRYEPTVRSRLVNAAQGIWVLEQLRFADEAEIRARIKAWSDWAPRHSRARTMELAKLVEARPEVVDAFVDSPVLELVSAAAGSRHLRDGDLQLKIANLHKTVALEGDNLITYKFALLKLANLPACREETFKALETASKLDGLSEVANALSRRLAKADRGTLVEPYEEVSEENRIKWLFRRALPKFEDAQDKPLEAEALGRNPNLTKEQAEEIAVFAAHRPLGMLDPEGLLRQLCARYGLTAIVREEHEPHFRGWEPHGPEFPDIRGTLKEAVLRRDGEFVAAWLDYSGLEEQEWFGVFAVADANPSITVEELCVLARSLA